MATLAGVQAPDPQTKFDSVQGYEWAARMTAFLSNVGDLTGVARLPAVQTFSGTNIFANSTIPNTNILLAANYSGQVVINETSSAQTGARNPGGNAALYIQHLIDGSTAAINNVNCGVRCQIESGQQSTAAINDLVCFYGGIYQSGVNVGGFGYHMDVYYAGSGGSSTMYGCNIEMNRKNATGVMVGYHLRVIQSAFSTVGTDYGYLISPSVGGSLAVTVGFSVGSSSFGAMPCAVAFDSTNAVTTVALRLATSQSIQWDGNGGFIRTLWDGTSWSLAKNGVPKFAVNGSTGTMQWFGGTQASATAGAASALPATPAGYYTVTLNTVAVQVPYYLS